MTTIKEEFVIVRLKWFLQSWEVVSWSSISHKSEVIQLLIRSFLCLESKFDTLRLLLPTNSILQWFPVPVWFLVLFWWVFGGLWWCFVCVVHSLPMSDFSREIALLAGHNNPLQGFCTWKTLLVQHDLAQINIAWNLGEIHTHLAPN